MTPWILFSSVSVFHYLNRNSLGPSTPQLALAESRSINVCCSLGFLPGQVVKDEPSPGNCTNYIPQSCRDSGYFLDYNIVCPLFKNRPVNSLDYSTITSEH